MRIAVLIDSLAIGGAEAQMALVLPVLRARGHDVACITIAPREALCATLEAAGIPVRTAADGERMGRGAVAAVIRNLRAVGRAAAVVRARRSEILLTVLPHACIVGAMAARLTGTLHIVARRSQNAYQHERGAVFGMLDRWGTRTARLVLANSEPVRTDLLAEGVEPARIVRVVNAVVPKPPPDLRAREATRAALGLGGDELVLVTVANLFAYKGHADIIAALGLLNRTGAMAGSWRLLVVGRDVDDKGRAVPAEGIGRRAVLERLASDAGIAAHVQFLGERADVSGLLEAADIGIHASLTESFSNALLEMAAAGLPIVATWVGGANELLGQGEAGLLVPPADPVALAEALAVLIRDASLGRRLAGAARQRAQASYGVASACDSLEAALSKALSG
ncbi:glycosyltransferase [Phreatobacter stygius]|uniref:glycosyltransferase n=1 Tax=Phreatobacter stygius TaxID=1940610 RepID=UPI001476F040|nr:glycosyltransferase [Phreatobacter stygius]